MEGPRDYDRAMASSRIIRSYRDLHVWRVAMDVRRDVRAILLKLPRQDRFEIGGQIARAALSIPSNIAEGYNRRGRNDYYQFRSRTDSSANSTRSSSPLARITQASSHRSTQTSRAWSRSLK